jgi:hypothetical protein
MEMDYTLEAYNTMTFKQQMSGLDVGGPGGGRTMVQGPGGGSTMVQAQGGVAP